MNPELYHFTQNVETIKNILESKHFRPSFCLERIDYFNSDKLADKDSYVYLNENEMAIPIVCFADLLDTEIENHSCRFGKYALVMSKEWALKNHLSPVIYTTKGTLLSDGILVAALNNRNELIQYLKQRKEERKNHCVADNEELDKKEEDIVQGLKNIWSFLMTYYKIYEGHQYNKQMEKFDAKKVSFYLEREWRFIPIELDSLPMVLSHAQYDKEIKDDKQIFEIRKNPVNNLQFEWKDILSIRIQEKDKDEVIEVIQKNWKVEPDAIGAKFDIF